MTSRTILETACCPTDLRRGDTAWSMDELEAKAVLGEGALSTVALCTCVRSRARLALKMYHMSRMTAASYQQAKQEIHIHAAFQSEHSIALFAAFEDADGVYLVQEYAPGGDMYGALAAAGGFLHEVQVAGGVMRPLLSALTQLHSQGVMHRDIKPENLLLCAGAGAPGGHLHVRLADFGLARRIGSGGMPYVGTLDYMAPEIAWACAAAPCAPDAPAALNPNPIPCVDAASPSPADQASCQEAATPDLPDRLYSPAGSSVHESPAGPSSAAQGCLQVGNSPDPDNSPGCRPGPFSQPLPACNAVTPTRAAASELDTSCHVSPNPAKNPSVGPRSPPAPLCGLATDVWAAGVLAYEMLVGGPPFEADTKAATYKAILEERPWLPPHLSAAARDFVHQALIKDPTRRPSAQQLLGHRWLANREPYAWKLGGDAPALPLAAPMLAPATPPRCSIAAPGAPLTVLP